VGVGLPLGPQGVVKPEIEAIAIAAGTAGLVGLVGATGTLALARRSVPAATAVGPAVVVASMAAGVWVAAREMFLSEQDLALISYILGICVPIALVCGFLLYRAVRRVDIEAGRAHAAREREQSLAASRREMISWASHDLRSPLAGIRIMSEALEDGLAADPADYHRRIRRESDRMTRMVDDLLEMSRLNQGDALGVPSRVDLLALTQDVARSQQVVAEQHGVQVHVEPGAPAVVVVDPALVERAVANVVHNAILYTAAGGAVTVSVGRSDAGADPGSEGGARAVLAVEDECGGVSPEELERMFDPGWRGSTHRTPQSTAGIGLGLTIARAIVEEAGGSARCQPLEQGCRITLELPRAAAAGS